MKKYFFLLSLFAVCSLTACGGDEAPVPPPVTPPEDPNPPSEPGGSTTPDDVTAFVRGADISWYTEMAADGRRFFNPAGQELECPVLMREIGMNAVRLRVWVNPEKKFCQFSDIADVTAKALAAKQAGLNVMIDFHFSDWWADPSRQETPAEWEGLSLEELKVKVAEHVRATLSSVTAQGVSVAWIQIGNETRNGMMHPTGQLWNDQGDLPGGWTKFVQLYMAGYDAAKEICPEAYVMPHLNHAYEDNDWWFKRFKQAGGKMDMIALSHYPQADDAGQTWSALNSQAVTQIKRLAVAYAVPVMVSEFGVIQTNITLGTQVANDFMTKVKALGSSVCAGVFYWEPQVYANWKPSSYNTFGWSAYQMGAFSSDGRPSSILDAWKQ